MTGHKYVNAELKQACAVYLNAAEDNKVKLRMLCKIHEGVVGQFMLQVRH